MPRKSMKINSETYAKTLKRLKEQISCIHEGKKLMLFLHDNVKPHTVAATSAAIESIEFQVVPHPLYSPDVAPSDFRLFAALKIHLKGIYFIFDEEVQVATGEWLGEQPEEFCTDRFENLFNTGGVISN
jgi:transposase